MDRSRHPDPADRGDRADRAGPASRGQPRSIGRFRIDGQLGAGGMGIVYEAWDPDLDRAVALKVLSPDHVQQEEARARLLREARAAASLNHPHIATVYEVGTSQGIDWIAMERIFGSTLRTRIRRGGHTLEEGLLWGLQVCDAIAEAHAHDLVHRDIKSPNVMVTTREEAKVLDFGLAIPSAWTQQASDSRPDRITQSGAVMGTVEYMAPEILRGDDSGPLGDVYALGTLLWEIIVGSTPYHGRTPAMTMNAILSDPVPNLESRVDNLPEGMAAVVARALAKRPEDRQSSAKHLLGELRAVIEALRHPGPRETQALSAVTGDVPHNLPAPITRFVGRERERQELTHLLGEHRLVTISGPGGAGKTRLAQELGRDRLQDFPGGVYFVDLAVRDAPAQVPSSIAAVFDLREEPGRSIEETLIEALRHRTVLLILDNCEHLVETCANLAARLLQECPDLRLVATSQERLGVPGEWMWEIPPLSLPAEEAPMADILESSSVQLFVDRATSVKSSFVLTEQSAPTVVQICRRLDAIPLAIELAAARVRILTVEQILERLEDRFRLLTGGARTLLPRQQTLHNTVSWSVELLSEEERLVYERISVFSGGFCLEAAEAVCSGDGLQSFAILDLLSRLVDKSLVTATTESETPRYEQLATLREFGEALMAQRHEAPAVRQRHAEFYLFLAESIAPKLTGPEQSSGFQRLAQEADNLTQALHWFVAQNAHGAVCLAAALWRYWFVRGHLSLGRTQLAAALAISESAAPDQGVSRAQALHGAGVLANDQGAYAAARAHFQEALAIRRRLQDAHGVAETLNSLGVAARDQGDYDTARTLLQEGLEIHRQREDDAGVAASIHALGITAHREGDCETARRLFEEGLTLRQRSGDRRGIAALLAHLGSVAYDQERYDEADRQLREALTMFEELDNKRGILWTLMHLGGIAQKRDEIETAQQHQENALRIAHELGDRHHIARSFEWIASLALVQGDARRALRLLGAAEALRQLIGSPRTPIDQRAVDADMESAHRQVGTEAVRALEEGRAWDVQAAVTAALSPESTT